MDGWKAFDMDLETALARLKSNAPTLRKRGIRHAAVFGSVARGDAGAHSDIDVLIELDPDSPIGLFAYATLKAELNNMLDGRADVVNRANLKAHLRHQILNEAVDAF